MLMPRNKVLNFVSAFLSTSYIAHSPTENPSTSSSTSSTCTTTNQCSTSPYQYHPPPPGVSYESNPTVFGRILEGKLPSCPYLETTDLYAFRDKYPRAPLHALVIPKQLISSVKALNGVKQQLQQQQPTDNSKKQRRPFFFQVPTKKAPNTISVKNEKHDTKFSDLDLLLQMKEVAYQVLTTEAPDAFRKKDYILCFHIPPFNSVNHLHLHVLAPASEMKLQYRFGKYLVGTKWCIGLDEVLVRLESMDGKIV